MNPHVSCPVNDGNYYQQRLKQSQGNSKFKKEISIGKQNKQTNKTTQPQNHKGKEKNKQQKLSVKQQYRQEKKHQNVNK